MRLKVLYSTAGKKVVVGIELVMSEKYAIIEFLTKDQSAISLKADRTDWLGYKLKVHL